MQLRHGKKIGILLFFVLCLLVLSLFFPFFSMFSITLHDPSDNILRFDQAMPFEFTGIDTDSKERCYVAFDTSVFVYDQHGQYLFRFTKPFQGSSFDFSINNDTLLFWYVRDKTVHQYSQDGTLLRSRKYNDTEAPNYKNFLEQRKCTVDGKLKYQYHSILGFWWVTDANNQVITHIPLLAFLIKISLMGIVVSAWILLQTWDGSLKTGDGSLS